MKKVLLVINSDLISAGVPYVVMTIVRSLHKKIIFDIVTYHKGKGIYDEEFKSYGGEIYPLSLTNYDKHKVLFCCRAVQIESFMRTLLKEKRYDAIHCHNGIESGIFLKIADKFQIPVRISHAHGTYYRSGKNKILLAYNKYCLKLIKKYSTKMVACSRLSGESLFGSADYENILNPIDAQSYKSIVKIEHKKITILQIGYYCNNKNQLFTIDVFAEVKKVYPDSELFFIGFEQEEGYLEKIKNSVESKNLKDCVHFLPPDTNKQSILSITDMVLLPSFSEGLPLVALEAQASMTPCIISKRVCEDVDIGFAYFAEYNNIESWVSLIKMLTEDKYENESKLNLRRVDSYYWCKHIMEIYSGNNRCQ